MKKGYKVVGQYADGSLRSAYAKGELQAEYSTHSWTEQKHELLPLMVFTNKEKALGYKKYGMLVFECEYIPSDMEYVVDNPDSESPDATISQTTLYAIREPSRALDIFQDEYVAFATNVRLTVKI